MKRGHVDGSNISPATSCMEFSWLEFVRHEAEQSDPNFQYRILCVLLLQTVPSTNRNGLIKIVIHYPNVPPMHVKGLLPLHVPVTEMSPGMFRP